MKKNENFIWVYKMKKKLYNENKSGVFVFSQFCDVAEVVIIHKMI
jgi:hypothetical protein